MKKRILTLLLALACLLVFAACDGNPATTSPVTTGSGAGTTEHTHSYSEWVVVSEATCAAEGLMERTCECGETEQQTIATTAHSFVDDICQNCGASASLGLILTLNADEQSYCITGIGTCTDEELVIPSAYKDLPITAIAAKAFYNCTGLKSVTVPDSVTSIGEGAFSGCSSLQSITVPFVGASATIEEGGRQYPFGYIFGTVAYTDGVGVTQFYPGEDSSNNTCDTYYIPSGLLSVTVTGGSIPYGAFSNCTMLTSVDLPDSVTAIGAYAFSGCANLTSISIPAAVTSIGAYAFCYCSALTDVVFENTSGWYVADTEAAGSGTAVDVTDAAAAAKYFTDTYLYHSWYRGE